MTVATYKRKHLSGDLLTILEDESITILSIGSRHDTGEVFESLCLISKLKAEKGNGALKAYLQ